MDRINRLPNNGFQNTPEGLKNYIIDQAWVKARINGQSPVSIWNVVTLDQEQQACRWDPTAVTSRLRNRGDTCPAPSSTTSSATHSATPNTALIEQPRVCNDLADFKGHGEINKDSQIIFAGKFCSAINAKSDIIYPPSEWPHKHTGFNLTIGDSHDINYSYRIQWVSGCVTTVPSFNVTIPLPDLGTQTCTEILVADYLTCKSHATREKYFYDGNVLTPLIYIGYNEGVGGHRQLGCVKYTFDGGLGQAPPCDECTSIDI